MATLEASRVEAKAEGEEEFSRLIRGDATQDTAGIIRDLSKSWTKEDMPKFMSDWMSAWEKGARKNYKGSESSLQNYFENYKVKSTVDQAGYQKEVTLFKMERSIVEQVSVANDFRKEAFQLERENDIEGAKTMHVKADEIYDSLNRFVGAKNVQKYKQSGIYAAYVSQTVSSRSADALIQIKTRAEADKNLSPSQYASVQGYLSRQWQTLASDAMLGGQRIINEVVAGRSDPASQQYADEVENVRQYDAGFATYMENVAANIQKMYQDPDAVKISFADAVDVVSMAQKVREGDAEFSKLLTILSDSDLPESVKAATISSVLETGEVPNKRLKSLGGDFPFWNTSKRPAFWDKAIAKNRIIVGYAGAFLKLQQKTLSPEQAGLQAYQLMVEAQEWAAQNPDGDVKDWMTKYTEPLRAHSVDAHIRGVLYRKLSSGALGRKNIPFKNGELADDAVLTDQELMNKYFGGVE